MSDERFQNEMKHLYALRDLLEQDTRLPLRLRIERGSLDFREFSLKLSGISAFVADPCSTGQSTAPAFSLNFRVPEGYPFSTIPNISFGEPVPLHPHIWTDGRICWGTAWNPRPDLQLSHWLVHVVEYLQYSQGDQSTLDINRNSLANRDALHCWDAHRKDLGRYVPPIDLARLRLHVARTCG